MWLAVLQLYHGRRSGDADPELAAVDGSDPPFWDASIGTAEGWHVQAHAPSSGGSLPVQGSLREGSRAADAQSLGSRWVASTAVIGHTARVDSSAEMTYPQVARVLGGNASGSRTVTRDGRSRSSQR